MIKQGFLRCGRGPKKKKKKGEKENKAKRWCTVGSWPPAAQANRQHKTTAALSRSPTAERGTEEELAEEERAAGQTVRGQGLNRGLVAWVRRTRCSKNLCIKRPVTGQGPSEVCSQCAQRSPAGTKEGWNSLALAERLGSAYRRRYGVFGGGTLNTSIHEKVVTASQVPHDHTMIGQNKPPIRWTLLLWQRQNAAKHTCDDFPDFFGVITDMLS